MVLESTPYCIALIDDAFRLVYSNQNFLRVVRHHSGKVIQVGQSLLEILPHKRHLACQLRMEEILSGQCIRVEEVLEVEGSPRTFDVSYQPLCTGHAWDRVVIFFEDVTMRKECEKKSLESQADLRQAIATRETLLSIISHDLRSPIFQLNSLLFIIQQASESRDERRLQLYAEDLEERIAHLTHTLDNLLSWSTLQRQSLEPRISRFSLNIVIDQAVGLMKPVAQRKGVSFIVKVEETIELCSDREMVAFIIRNLINNAIKFSLQKGEIVVSAVESEGRVVLSTSDQGVGVEPQRIISLREGQHMFTEPGTWGERGTGIGLKLCYEFAERLEGSLEFVSKPGRGTSVTVRLPQLLIP